MEDMQNKEVTTEPTEVVENTQVQGQEVDKDAIEAELRKEFEKEADRRVTEAIKKVTKKLKEEQAEAERKAKLTAEELHKEELEKTQRLQAEKEKALTIKELKLNLVDVLTEQGMDLGFRELIDVNSIALAEEDKRGELLKDKVSTLKSLFDGLVEKRVEQVKKEFLTGSTPQVVGDKGVHAPTNDYDKAKKVGNVRGMLASKIKDATLNR